MNVHTGKGASTPLIVWRAQYNTGIPELDTGHRQLVDTLNRLDAAVSERAAPAVVRDLLLELVRRIKDHFAHEQRIMKVMEFPDRMHHLNRQKRLLEQLANLTRRYSDGEHSVLEGKARKVLAEWLVRHILREDKEIKELGATQRPWF